MHVLGRTLLAAEDVSGATAALRPRPHLVTMAQMMKAITSNPTTMHSAMITHLMVGLSKTPLNSWRRAVMRCQACSDTASRSGTWRLMHQVVLSSVHCSRGGPRSWRIGGSGNPGTHAHMILYETSLYNGDALLARSRREQSSRARWWRNDRRSLSPELRGSHEASSSSCCQSRGLPSSQFIVAPLGSFRR